MSHGLSASDYHQAALDDSASLGPLYERCNYALTVYVSGLAVECLFRVFREKKGLPFRSDHSLAELAEEAGSPNCLVGEDHRRFLIALGDLVLRWRNSHRFRSHEALRRFLKGLELDRRIKGDFVKENSRVASSAALEIVRIGVQKWEI